MDKRNQFIGVVGIVLLIFGMITYALVAADDFFIVPFHFVFGILFLSWFVISGGIGALRSTAAKRATSFSFGALLYTALFVGIIGLANYVTRKHEFFYFDTTEQKVFTLAPQTEEILKHLEYPLVLRAFFLSGKVDPKVDDLLNRLSRASDKVTWKAVDPERQPALTEKLGVNEAETIHLSYEVEAGKPRESKVTRDITEESLVNAILKLTRSAPHKAYYLQGHGEADLSDDKEGGFLFLKEAIQGENISVTPLELGGATQVPDDASMLLVLAPRHTLLATEKGAIENYLKRGGNVLFMAEPNTTNDVADLVRPLGIIVKNDMVVDQTLQLFAGPSLGVQPMVSTYGDHAITKNFNERTVFSTVCSVRPAEQIPQGATVTTLATTSEASWAESDLKLLLSEDPRAVKDSADVSGPVSIAVAYEGTGKVVVIGDVDFIANINIRQLYNRDFVLNAIDWLVGSGEQVSIRARTLRESVKTITPDQFNLIFLLSALIFPELLLILGLSIWWARRS